MKKILMFALSSALLAPSLQAQVVTTAEEDRKLYLDSLEYQARADICADKLEGFADKLKPLLRKWKVRNDARLRVGDAFFREEAVREQITVEEKLDKAVHETVEKLKVASAAELQKNCDEVLDFYGPDGPYSGNPKPKKKDEEQKKQSPAAQAPAQAPTVPPLVPKPAAKNP